MTELMVILVIALLVLGPKRLPDVARSLGKGLAEFRRASTDMRREFLDVAEEARIDPSSLAAEESVSDEPSPPEEALASQTASAAGGAGAQPAEGERSDPGAPLEKPSSNG